MKTSGLGEGSPGPFCFRMALLGLMGCWNENYTLPRTAEGANRDLCKVSYLTLPSLMVASTNCGADRQAGHSCRLQQFHQSDDGKADFGAFTKALKAVFHSLISSGYKLQNTVAIGPIRCDRIWQRPWLKVVERHVEPNRIVVISDQIVQ